MKAEFKKGDIFGRLTFIELVQPYIRPSGKVTQMGRCICLCGVERIVRLASLKNGTTKSCGCIRLERIKKARITHGLRKDRLYNIYRNILARCNNPKAISYKWYGAKGIEVCRNWRYCPNNFFDWAKTSGYKENLQIDRIDNTKGYSPENCHWVTPKENSSNKNNNIKYNGETATMASERLNGSRFVVSRRMAAGWDIKKAFTTPINKNLSHPKK